MVTPNNVDFTKLRELLTNMRNALPHEIASPSLSNFDYLLDQALPLDESEVWKPHHHQYYWLINTDGIITQLQWLDDSENDQARLAYGNVFPTREAAEAHKQKYLEWLKNKS